MKKVRITADAVLAIIKGIFEDEEINVHITDNSAPENWQGKKVNEILNVEYYTFKHRPISTQKIINKLLEDNRQVNCFESINRAFCLLSLGKIERLYSKDTDMVALSASLEYYIQTSKIKLLEYLIEDCNIATSGLRIPVEFGQETRKAVIFLGRPRVSDIQTSTPFGEAALVDVDVTIMFYPDVISYSEYTVNVAFSLGNERKSADIPLTSFSCVNAMTQDAVPYIEAKNKVGNINLSCANSFVMVFDGYNNDFINYLANRALSAEKQDNNQVFTITIKRGDDNSYTHEVIIKDHQMTVNADTGNETHTVTFLKRGLKNGIA
ncbi:MAG: hypothetical protein K2L70_00725 [Clostridia bacterium]|nr:hypothetical protein [Clostridia bacterium]